jgi:glycosyltransferase involved in cell wall biosynthesis
MIGDGGEKELSEMWDVVRAVGVQERFSHYRSLDAAGVVSAMQSSSVFLLPSRIDTGPTALKEALCMGLWPVCYDNSGPGEYLRLFRFGSLARDGDCLDLTNKLAAAFHSRPWADRELRMQLAQLTRERFSKEAIWKQLIGMYEEIISPPN